MMSVSQHKIVSLNTRAMHCARASAVIVDIARTEETGPIELQPSRALTMWYGNRNKPRPLPCGFHESDHSAGQQEMCA